MPLVAGTGCPVGDGVAEAGEEYSGDGVVCTGEGVFPAGEGVHTTGSLVKDYGQESLWELVQVLDKKCCHCCCRHHHHTMKIFWFLTKWALTDQRNKVDYKPTMPLTLS